MLKHGELNNLLVGLLVYKVSRALWTVLIRRPRPADGRWSVTDGAWLRLSPMTSLFEAILEATAVTLRLQRGGVALSLPVSFSSHILPSSHITSTSSSQTLSAVLSSAPFTSLSFLLFSRSGSLLCLFISPHILKDELRSNSSRLEQICSIRMLEIPKSTLLKVS